MIPADSTTQGIAGLELAFFTAVAERSRLRFFAQATGQQDPVYTDLQAARQAGHEDLPVPPTFLFCLERDGVDTPGLLESLDIDMRQILHGEQGFVFHRVAVAGEVLHFSPRIVGDHHKRDGALRFLIRETEVTCDGAPVAELRNVIVVRRMEFS